MQLEKGGQPRQESAGEARVRGSRLRRRTVPSEPVGIPGELVTPGTEPTDMPFDEGERVSAGRLRMVGCSPGCLLASLVVSIVLTVVLNLILNIF